MLSALVITHNEEDNIARCLRSLEFADEIIVIDSNSHDRTATIAAQHGANVFIQPWLGYGPQKNYAIDQSHGDWLLFVDADEEISEPLAQEILNITKQDAATAPIQFFWFRIITIFLGKPLRHLYGHNLRLFTCAAGRWNDAPVHEQVITHAGQPISLGSPISKVLTSPLLHHSHKTIASYLKKMHRYTRLDAKNMLVTGQHRSGRPIKPSPWLPLAISSRQLIKLLFYRRGILDGWPGFLWCCLSAYYEYEMGVKYLLLHKKANTTNRHPV